MYPLELWHGGPESREWRTIGYHWRTIAVPSGYPGRATGANFPQVGIEPSVERFNSYLWLRVEHSGFEPDGRASQGRPGHQTCPIPLFANAVAPKGSTAFVFPTYAPRDLLCNVVQRNGDPTERVQRAACYYRLNDIEI